MLTLTDEALIRASLSEPSAFAGIFDRHWERIHRFCVSRTGAAGEDLAAETFRVAFDQRDRFDQRRADVRPWLFGIATNLLRNHFRSAARGQRAVAKLGAETERDPSEEALMRVEAALLSPDLAAGLAALSAAERDTLLLYVWVELTYEEIAVALDVPVGTVRSRIHRARTAMHAHLVTASKDHR